MARWLAIVVVLAACTSGQGDDPAGSRARIDLVYLYPAQVTLVAKATQQFDVQVVGAPIAKPAARLYVEGVEGGDDRVGRISASGAFTAL
jgi:hypothetical protein